MHPTETQCESDVFETPLIAPKKNNRIIWSNEMHSRFLQVLMVLGEDASPSKILRRMNVRGLTRLQVSSHYQKHRKTSKKSMAHFLEDTTSSPDVEQNENEKNLIFSIKKSTILEEFKYYYQCPGMLSTNCGNIATSYLPQSGFCSCV